MADLDMDALTQAFSEPEQEPESAPPPPQSEEVVEQPTPAPEETVLPSEPPTPPVAAEVTPSPHTLSEAEWETYTFYRDLDARVLADQELAQRLRTAFNPPPPAPQTAPDLLEEDAPSTTELRNTIKQLQETINRHDEMLVSRAQIENDATMARVKEAFKVTHNISDAEMAQVYDNAQQFAGSLGTYARQGVALDEALTKVFESSYWQIEEFRNRELANLAAQQQEDQARKAKAGSLSGSSGSAPRTPDKPDLKNEQTRRELMIQALSSPETE